MKLAIAISGGGALGIGPLQFMRRLEADLSSHLADAGAAFAGTSTGSIVAAGLCSGMTASQLYDLYRCNLPAIFTKVKTPQFLNILSSDYHRYDNTNLKKLLQQNFRYKMYEFKKPIFIPSTFMNGDSVEKVWDRGDGMSDQWFAVLSSCSAPTYFDPVSREKNGKTEIYCDGGMWSNDPIMVLESGLNKVKEFKDNYKILSFNTGMRSANKAPTDHSIIGWGKYIMEEWVARTGRSGYFQACANIGEKNVYRVVPEVDKKYAMDDLSVIDTVSDIWDKLYDQIGKEVCEFVKSTEPAQKLTKD
ncbi:patatin-like phospholipase family protein [Fibrobacter sp. UWB13]|jgi:patatin-like phospholipase/acyl hydrolase|uniref:patatin-like phospholipase family protein n=1 Tax=Fibrobacter sp. UWB13 TaxID=1896204 RepID=UPI000A0C97CF|nr:patatin-like phospholipase family protein [Fibrobacter sp. UWB13]SMG12684.1 Patatin-like phospholipase [Fibrobacter sp. UWB13]